MACLHARYSMCFVVYVQTDFLLVLLRDMVQTFPDLHVILMSATIDTTLFCDYFVGCCVVEVHGRVHAVQGLPVVLSLYLHLWVLNGCLFSLSIWIVFSLSSHMWTFIAQPELVDNCGRFLISFSDRFLIYVSESDWISAIVQNLARGATWQCLLCQCQSNDQTSSVASKLTVRPAIKIWQIFSCGQCCGLFLSGLVW